MKKREFFKQFVSYIDDKKPFIQRKTYLTYQVTYRQLQAYFFNKDTVSEESLKAFIVHRMETSISGARKDGININAFLKASGLKFRLKKPKNDEATIKYLNKREVFAIRNNTYAYDPEISRLSQFAIDTGLRLGELIYLRMADVDYDNEMITVRNYTDHRTKTGKFRLVPLTDRALDLLLPAHEEEFVFRFNVKEKDRYVQKHLKKWIKQLGLRTEISAQMFRHTYATLLIRAGVDIYTVSELMGHSELKTTLNYAKLDIKTKKAAVRTLD